MKKHLEGISIGLAGAFAIMAIAMALNLNIVYPALAAITIAAFVRVLR